MNKTKRMSNQIFILVTSVAIWIVAFCPGFAFAAASLLLTRTGDGSTAWAIGTLKASATTDSTSLASWTVTNDNDSGGTEDIYIKVTGVNWNPGAAAGEDIFVLKHNVPSQWSSAITNSGNGIFLKESLADQAGQAFHLQFQTPSSTVAQDGVEQTLTVTLTATNWVVVAAPCTWNSSNSFTVTHTIKLMVHLKQKPLLIVKHKQVCQVPVNAG